MIIFYNKKSGDIFGVIEGRVHDNTGLTIKPKDIPEEDIGKYIVPFMTMEDKTGLFIDSSFAEILYKFEDKSENIYKYKVTLGENGELSGFTKK